MILIWIAAWVLTGLWSFIATQSIVGGWDYVRNRPEPWKIFWSAMLMGPITTFFCLLLLIKFFIYRRKEP